MPPNLQSAHGIQHCRSRIYRDLSCQRPQRIANLSRRYTSVIGRRRIAIDIGFDLLTVLQRSLRLRGSKNRSMQAVPRGSDPARIPGHLFENARKRIIALKVPDHAFGARCMPALDREPRAGRLASPRAKRPPLSGQARGLGVRGGPIRQARSQKILKCIGRKRLREQEALQLVATFRL